MPGRYPEARCLARRNCAAGAPEAHSRSLQSRLGQRLLNHAPVEHTGQTLIEPLVEIRELRVVEAHQVKNRRVQIADVTGLFDGPEPDFVGSADGLATLDAAAGQPHREAVPV